MNNNNQLQGAFKILFVNDKDKAKHYYMSALGFKDEARGCFELEAYIY